MPSSSLSSDDEEVSSSVASVSDAIDRALDTVRLRATWERV